MVRVLHTLLAACVLLSASATTECTAGNETCKADATLPSPEAQAGEELALLAHKRAAVRVHHYDDSTISRQSRWKAANRCHDDPAGWRSSAGVDCQTYVDKNYCTHSGGYGRGWWQTFWGEFSDYAVAGVDATMACCGCGGGKVPLCRADEASGVERFGLSFLFPDGSDGCSAATCTPSALLQRGLQETLEGVSLEDGSCGCWALDGTGGRIFLFASADSSCDAEGCWQKYVHILQIFQWGDHLHFEGGVPLAKPADDLYNERHWSTACSTAGKAQAMGLAPVSQLTSSLQIWGELDKQASILKLVSLEPIGGGLPPLQSEELVAGLLKTKDSLPFEILEWVLRQGGQVASLVGREDSSTILGTTFGWDYYSWLYNLGARRLGSPEQNQEWFLDLPPGSSATTRRGPGANTTSFYSWREVKGLLETLGAKFESGQAQRANELGLIILNGVLWSEAPGGRRSIALGAAVEIHAIIRPFIADALDNARGGPECDGSSCWSPEWLRSRARSWLEQRTSFTEADLGSYVVAVLAKVHLNIDFSDKEARAFLQYVKDCVKVIIWTERQAGSWLLRKALNIPELQAQRTAYLELMTAAFQAKFPQADLSPFVLEAAVAAFLDSMQFAGTLSVPTALETVLGLTHRREENKWAQLQGLSLDSSNIDAVLWETLRMYPPVLGFPWWEKVGEKWEHKMPVLNMVLLDEEIYHNPMEFILRPLQHYEKHSIGFVDFAVHPPGEITAESIRAPHSRRCPGKDLALQIMRTFLQEFVALGPWWSQGGKDIHVGAGVVPSFTLEKKVSGCWMPPSACASTWLYKLRRYTGCATVDSDAPWCSHHSVYVYGRWSLCKLAPPPCEERYDEVAETVALDALTDCKFGSSGSPKEKAACVCKHANVAPRLLCKELSTVALELSSPWGCSLRQSDGREECVAYSPWYLRAPKQITQTWKSVKHWGKSYVGTDRCYPTNDKCCAQSALATVAAKCSDITAATFTNEWVDLPEQLQGVFWLQDQGINSALTSFGRTRDGCGFSPGHLGSDAVYHLRVGGDRCWSFATTQGGAFRLASGADGVYEFHFDSATNPTFARVVPSSRVLFGATVPPFFAALNITLVTSDSPYPESFVWRRELSGGLAVTQEVKEYYIVQVIDAFGRRLPAFDEFVRYCEDPLSSGSTSPGFIWLNRYDGDAAEVVSQSERLEDCAGLGGFVLPTVLDFGFAVANAPFFHLDKKLNFNLRRDVVGDFGHLMYLGITFGSLVPFNGRYDQPVKRMCAPQATRPLKKLFTQETQVPLEELDAGGVCKPDTANLSPLELCAQGVLERVDWDDSLDSGNTWERALQGEGDITKEGWIMQHYDRTNADGDSIYPAQVFDYRDLYYRDGLWQDALEAHFALDLIGTHLVQEVRAPALSHGGETAALVLPLNAYAGLELRKGFSPWGGDMYFSASGKVLMIERVTAGGAKEQLWADSTPSKQWQYAKFVFRATLINAVTIVDHLWFLHLTAANAMAIVAREQLLPEHPLRRLLSATSFGSIAVNAMAAMPLLGNRQLLHRATPFADWQQVHNAGEELIRTLEGYFGPFINASKMAALHPYLQEAPLYKDGVELFGALSNMVDRFFAVFGEEWCSAGSDLPTDQGIQSYADGMEAFLREERSSRAEANLAWLKGSGERPWTCTALKKLLKCHLFGVSGLHQHVGKVADFIRDPEIASSSWVEGEVSGRPRHALLASLVAAATGFIGVKLDQDFGFLFTGLRREAQLKGVFKQFSSDLVQVGRRIDRHNQQRKVPYPRMHPSEAEISLFQ